MPEFKISDFEKGQLNGLGLIETGGTSGHRDKLRVFNIKIPNEEEGLRTHRC